MPAASAGGIDFAAPSGVPGVVVEVPEVAEDPPCGCSVPDVADDPVDPPPSLDEDGVTTVFFVVVSAGIVVDVVDESVGDAADESAGVDVVGDEPAGDDVVADESAGVVVVEEDVEPDDAGVLESAGGGAADSGAAGAAGGESGASALSQPAMAPLSKSAAAIADNRKPVLSFKVDREVLMCVLFYDLTQRRKRADPSGQATLSRCPVFGKGYACAWFGPSWTTARRMGEGTDGGDGGEKQRTPPEQSGGVLVDCDRYVYYSFGRRPSTKNMIAITMPTMKRIHAMFIETPAIPPAPSSMATSPMTRNTAAQ